jgi:transposase-like protein
MLFPIIELLDDHESSVWIEKHFPPKGLHCPGCGAPRQEARAFRRHKRGFVDYRCHNSHRTYNLYTGPLFAGSKLAPRRVVLLVRGICRGEPATVLAEELSLSRQCGHRWRKRLQANGDSMLSQTALPDRETETEEMLQNAGEKRGQTLRSV